MATRTRIVQIGNSRGVRIPKQLLDESGIEGEVIVSLEEGAIVIRPETGVREGWEEELKRMMAEEGPVAPESTGSTRFDREEWTWE